jgi:predicted dehydrogenase
MTAIRRRDALAAIGGLASAVAGSRVFGAPAALAEANASPKLNVALIGCGGRGRSYLPGLMRRAAAGEVRVAALVDCDEGSLGRAVRTVAQSAEKAKVKGFDPTKVKTFTDYRPMYDEIASEIDAVLIATPDHQHACPSMMAIKQGKHVYCEKPLVHHIYEARALAEAAAKAQVATQMGNQGSGTGNHQTLAEYLEAGAIGKLLEAHAWHGFHSRFGGSMPKPQPQPVPKGLDWDAWLGPAAARPYSSVYRPWHGWCDFGTGSLGGWGTHVMDALCFALKLGAPTTVELVEVDDPSHDRFPNRTTVRYDFPQRGDLPPISVFWYDGNRPNTDPNLKGRDGKPARLADHYPALHAQIRKEHGHNPGSAGSILVGEKGMICCRSHGAAPVILPASRRRELRPPPKKLPRPSGGIMGDFFRACSKGGGPTFSGFDTFAGPFLEMLFVGHLAMFAGLNKPVEWDGERLECTNRPELAQYVKGDYRKGWTL